MKIRMLTMESFDNRKPNSVGSSRIRGRWVMKYWKECKPYKIGEDIDVMIYQKAYWQEHMQEFEGLKIFDLCDPDWLEGRPVKEVSEYMDAIVVPTETLKESLDKFSSCPVYVIKDRFNLKAFPEPKLEHNGRGRRVVWYGYSSNAHVLDKAYSTMSENDLSLTTISEKPISGYDGFIKYDWNTVHSDIQDHDFVLLPPADSDDIRFPFKSDNKTHESQLLGMPVAKSAEDVKRFLDPQERTKEAKERYEQVKKDYDVKISANEWKELVSNLLEERA